MEHVDLTTPASVSAPHIAAAMCTKLAQSHLPLSLPVRLPGLGSAGSALLVWGRGLGTERPMCHLASLAWLLSAPLL